MDQKPQKNYAVSITIAVLGVVGTLCAAVLTYVFNSNLENKRQAAEFTRIAIQATSDAQLKATPKLIIITLVNNNCEAQDFYVDGNLAVGNIVPNAKMIFTVIPGEHQVYACYPKPANCVDPVKVNWTAPTTWTISPSPACMMVTITLTNYHCDAMDYYVDGQSVVSSLAGGATTTFQIAPGQHSVDWCAAGTTNCGEKTQYNWTTSTTSSIEPGSTCLITITLTNNHCAAQDEYVDGKLVVSSLAEGATATFQIAPGKHSANACAAGTTNCGGETPYDWASSTSISIMRGPTCP